MTFPNVWILYRLQNANYFFFPCTIRMSALPVGMWYGNNFTTSMCRQRVNWIKCNLLQRRNELLGKWQVCECVCGRCSVKTTWPVVLIQLLKLFYTSEELCKLKLKLICVSFTICFFFPSAEEISAILIYLYVFRLPFPRWFFLKLAPTVHACRLCLSFFK